MGTWNFGDAGWMLPERGGWAGRLRRILYEERDCDGTVKKKGWRKGSSQFRKISFLFQSAWHAAELCRPIFQQGFVDLYDWLRFSGIFSISTPRICHLGKLSFSKISSKKFLVLDLV